MSFPLIRSADKVFYYVLSLLERLEQGQSPDPLDEQLNILAAIEEGDQKFRNDKVWEASKFALAAWCDEVLIDAPWDVNKWWKDNTLVQELFQESNTEVLFFQKAADAAQLSDKTALEVYYIAVALGFRGFYRRPNREEIARRLGIPSERSKWADIVAKKIRREKSIAELPNVNIPGFGAPPLTGKYEWLSSALVLWILLTANIVVGIFLVAAYE